MIELATIPYGEIVTGFAGFGAAWFYVRQKLSSQKLELTKYQAETELIVMIQSNLNDANLKLKELNTELDNLRKMINEKDVAISELTLKNQELTHTKETLESKIEVLNNLINRLSTVIDETTVRIENAIR